MIFEKIPNLLIINGLELFALGCLAIVFIFVHYYEVYIKAISDHL